MSTCSLSDCQVDLSPGSICQTAGVDEISVPGHCCKSSRICMKGFTSAVYPSDIYSMWLDTTGKSQL